VKVAFFKAASLDPLPPVGSKQKDVRYFHIHEGDVLDEAQFIDWVKQASEQPGEKMCQVETLASDELRRTHTNFFLKSQRP
jgi:hypothetical protein